MGDCVCVCMSAHIYAHTKERPSEDIMRSQSTASQEESSRQELNELRPWSWTSKPSEQWEIKFPLFKPLVHGILLRQLQQTNIDVKLSMSQWLPNGQGPLSCVWGNICGVESSPPDTRPLEDQQKDEMRCLGPWGQKEDSSRWVWLPH